MKNRQRIIIGVHADAIRVQTLRAGKIAKRSCVRVVNVNASDAWEDGLRAYDDALSKALEDTGVSAPCEARVVYEAPTAAVSAGLTNASGRAGADAALIELETRGGADLSIQPHASWVVGSCEDNKALCVAVTDTALTLDTLTRFLERAGVEMLSCTPSEAVGLAGALSLHRDSAVSGPRLCAWFGEWSSGVVVASSEGVRFVRSSPLTLDALVHAMTGIGDHDNTLTSDDAFELLSEFGIPDADSNTRWPEQLRSLNVHAARAAIQPLLQRTAVDLRQSLRFGLGKDEMEHASMHVGGQASRIGGLLPLVSELLGVSQPHEAHFDDEAHTLSAIDRLALVDPDRLSHTKAKAVRKALWIGSAIAIGVSVGQGMMAMDEGAGARESLVALRSGSTSIEAIQQRDAVIIAKETLIGSVDRAITTSAGFGPRWPGWLIDLADRRPERIVVLGMSLSREESDAGLVTMNGAVIPQAFMDAATESTAAPEGTEDAEPEVVTTDRQMDLLSGFIASLEASPLVAGVELGPTRRGSALGADATSFQLTVTLRAAPTLADLSTIAEASNE